MDEDDRARTIAAVAREIGDRLAAVADERTQSWWQRYLKGVIPFRGVPMSAIRSVVAEVWTTRPRELDGKHDGLELSLHLFSQRYAEDKLSAVLLLAEHLLHELTAEDVPMLAEPFRRRYIGDWNTCDWYCVKVLGRLIASSDAPVDCARRIADWRIAPGLWQRRAAAVSFVNLAPRGDEAFPGLVDVVLEVCASNVEDGARFSQSGVGWVLRELSRADPAGAAAFVHQHAGKMSREAVRMATARLPRSTAERLRAGASAAEPVRGELSR